MKKLPIPAEFSMGTSQYYKNPLFPRVKYTDGVRYVAQTAKCYWLIDKIASLITANSPEFMVFKLKTNLAESSAVLIIEDGDLNEIGREVIGFTDFPAEEQVIWAVHGVLLLPEEY